MRTIGYAANAKSSPLKPHVFERREPRPNDVCMEILYCGICHSDLHMVNDDWGMAVFPMVPGHEIIGRVIAVGSDVKKYKVGDDVAVGCMVDSCMVCDQCRKGEEQLCREMSTLTYCSCDRIDGTITQGGYSKHLVVREEFTLKVPDGLDLSRAAPLLCAGITTYSPLRTWHIGPGSRVGVVGLGGLGHMAVKLASAMGADVTVISRSASREAEAKRLGADRLLVSTDKAAMEQALNSLDLIIDTVPVKHDIDPYIPLLDIDGTLCIVGQVGPMPEFDSAPMLFGRRRIAGSPIGGIAETQEMLNFCAKKNVLPDCEMISIDQVNEAYKRLEKSDVKYRFVIDMASLKMA